MRKIYSGRKGRMKEIKKKSWRRNRRGNNEKKFLEKGRENKMKKGRKEKEEKER
jgi:hypothetical protein